MKKDIKKWFKYILFIAIILMVFTLSFKISEGIREDYELNKAIEGLIKEIELGT